MSQKDQGNKQSEKGEYKGHGKEKKTVAQDMGVGSSDGDGIRFTVPDHPDLSKVRTTEK